jgi:hypothetical protein
MQDAHVCSALAGKGNRYEAVCVADGNTQIWAITSMHHKQLHCTVLLANPHLASQHTSACQVRQHASHTSLCLRADTTHQHFSLTSHMCCCNNKTNMSQIAHVPRALNNQPCTPHLSCHCKHTRTKCMYHHHR